jgi:hypothetical protein
LTFKVAADWIREQLRDESGRLEVLDLLGLDGALFDLSPERIGHYGLDERGINSLDGDLLLEIGDPRSNLLAAAADARVLGLPVDDLVEARMQSAKAQATARVRWMRARPLPPIVVSVGSFPPPGWSGDFLRVLSAPQGRRPTARKAAQDWLLRELGVGREVVLGEGEAIRQIAYEKSSSTQSVGLLSTSWRTLQRAADELVEKGLAEFVSVPRPGRKAATVVRLAAGLRQPMQMLPDETLEAVEQLAEAVVRPYFETMETAWRPVRTAMAELEGRFRIDRKRLRQLVGVVRRE